MKRPALVMIVNVVQTLLGLLLAGTAVYLVILSRSAATLAEPDAAETAHGLLIGALVSAIPAVITLIAAAGLWKAKFWGWALSLATDVGVLAVLIYDMIGDSNLDTDDIAPVAAFLVSAVLLLLPAVRKWFWIPARGARQA